MTSSSSSIFWLIIVNRNCLQECYCDLISGKLDFKLIYITILLYYTMHVACCFVQKYYFNLNYRNAWGNHLRSLKGKFSWIFRYLSCSHQSFPLNLFMVYMATNLTLLMITLITKKVSIDGLWGATNLVWRLFVDENFVNDEQNLWMEKWLYPVF